MIDLTPIFEAIFALLAALVTYKLIPWIKARTTAEQQSLLAATVKTLVYAAEQLYGAGKGAEKLDYVISELEKRGFTADRAAIEAAVAEQLGKEKSNAAAGMGRARGEPLPGVWPQPETLSCTSTRHSEVPPEISSVRYG